ncbi:3-oxoacyl-ACP synthase [Streptomyces sp. CB00316]|uniref:beta-ketoacyl-[acyl-carrier-protein] synthase family protein n=1 Tax=unclassified Streptomyces TaxID=2593676 RepID=UPI00093C1489|nr:MULTISPECIES: beta-ketoacyl-[acyl-carrier-protein] synthase family protein [unclassified Streptomyces]MBT2425505.1 beta-ketoacyl-[acyl-carrier-protein] synthase family protein [Streptomyces sp. ISL-112]MBT2465681.1 beta-ketoacyl-[acyl-carrier-protein] synthase family protein [Streptomyces sp. ISL-63]OKJ23645.1 3-oxoacyl-ACP synthase [Streptomyces sp. CB00316]
MTGDDIAVTGIGLVTPGGIGTEPTWDAVCAGRATAHTDPVLAEAGAPVRLACRVPPRERGRGRLWRFDPATRFLLTAAREALASARLDPARWDAGRVAVVVGTAAGGISTLEEQHRKLLASGPGALSPMTLSAFLPNMAAGHLALELGATGPSLQTSTACASGATAIITAALLLRAGACDIAVAGGTDAMVTPLCASAFAKMGALSRREGNPGGASRPFDRDRDGFVLGEGCGVLVLERAAHAAARTVGPSALLAGYGATGDAHHPTAPHPEGVGLRAAAREALARAGRSPDEVDHINAHGTSTALNDAVEATAIRELYGTGHAPSVTSAKGVLGHTMGAAGAIEAALTVLSIARGTVPPTANFTAPDATTAGIDIVRATTRPQRVGLALSHSLGFGGHNTVLAFTAA